MLSTKSDSYYNGIPILSFSNMFDDPPADIFSNQINFTGLIDKDPSYPVSVIDVPVLGDELSLNNGEENFDIESFLKFNFTNDDNVAAVPTQQIESNSEVELNCQIMTSDSCLDKLNDVNILDALLNTDFSSSSDSSISSDNSYLTDTCQSNLDNKENICHAASSLPGINEPKKSTIGFQIKTKKFIKTKVTNSQSNNCIRLLNKNISSQTIKLRKVRPCSPTSILIENMNKNTVCDDIIKSEIETDSKLNLNIKSVIEMKPIFNQTLNMISRPRIKEEVKLLSVVKTESGKFICKKEMKPVTSFKVATQMPTWKQGYKPECNFSLGPIKLRPLKRELDKSEQEIEVIDLTLPDRNCSQDSDEPLPKRSVMWFVCPKCYIILSNKTKVRKHLNSDHRIFDFIECRRCDQVYLNKSQLSEHMLEMHAIYDCRECGAKFLTKAKWEQHIGEGHADTNPFHCESCCAFFKRETVYFNHLRTKHNRTIKFQCLKCDATYNHRKSLSIHLRLDHNEFYSCCQCFNTFPSSAKLAHHVNTVHSVPLNNPLIKNIVYCPEDPSPYKCRLCQATYRGKSYLEKHLISVHNLSMSKEELETLFKVCEFCPSTDQATFQTQVTLNNHIRKVHNINLTTPSRHNSSAAKKFRPASLHQESFQCTACSLMVQSVAALKDHYRKQHFKCDRCSSVFASDKALRHHVASAHLSGVSFPCTECAETFVNDQCLNDHLNAVHFRVFMYSCPQCDESFGFASALSQHTETFHPFSGPPTPASQIQPLFEIKIKTDDIKWVPAAAASNAT